MIQKIFTVFDSKAEAYGAPFVMGSRGEALRGFADAVGDSQCPYNKHPEDYTLFELGEYDTACAVITTYDTPKSLGVAIEFVKAQG